MPPSPNSKRVKRCMSLEVDRPLILLQIHLTDSSTFYLMTPLDGHKGSAMTAALRWQDLFGNPKLAGLAWHPY
jgi:hypothetical protein